MARISLADAADLPEDQRDLIKTLSTVEGLSEQYHHLIEEPERNVYRTVARQPRILEPFRTFGSAVWEHCGLSPRQRELAILAVGAEMRADYEFHQHVRIALREGIEPAEIQAVVDGDDERFDETEQAILAYTRAYVNREVDDATCTALVEAFDEPTVVGTSLLAGIYTMIGLLGDALALETEEPFVGWELERLYIS